MVAADGKANNNYPLEGVRVLELSHSAGAVCGRILADLGAEVIKIEPHGGEPARRGAPRGIAGGEEISMFWLAFNVGKKSVCLDLESQGGLKAFVDIAASADLVVTDFERLSCSQSDTLFALVKDLNRQLVWTDILPFGRGKPFEDYPAGDISLQALGGHLLLNGDRDRPPVRIGLPVAALNSGVEGASAALMAWYDSLRTGEGQRVDVSIQACITWTLLNSTMTWQLLGDNEERGGAVKKERANKFYTRLVWECADGHVFFAPVGGGLGIVRAKSYAALVAWMAEDGFNDSLLTAKDWTGADAFRIAQEEYNAVSEIIGRFIRTKTTEQLMARGVAEGILLAPISDIPQILKNVHLRARGFFETLEDGGRGTRLEYPMHWCRFEKTPLKTLDRAPGAGEHQSLLREKTAVRATVKTRETPPGKQIFSGVKVVDFTWAAAGPIGIKQLADNGATVVKIESSRHPDSVRLGGPFKDDKPGLNRSGFFADFNSSKLSIALDMTHKRAGEIIEPLLRLGDIVAVSFRPGVMERWGFGYERLRQINPRLIMINSSLFGLSGPWSSSPGFGAQGQAIAGFNGQTGWPDRSPVAPKGAYTDSVSARYMAAALVAAMIHRERTGEGQFIELAQVETGVQFLAPQLLEYQLTGMAASRNGNANPHAILHGVFPCAGEDRWIAIEAWTQDQWIALLRVLDAPELVEAVSGVGARQTRELMESQVAARTANRDAFLLMAELRAARVPCGVALKASELLQDSCLRNSGHFWPLEHAEMGTLDYNGPAYRFGKTPVRLTHAAPLLGQHTDYVLSEILSFDKATIDTLRAANLFV